MKKSVQSAFSSDVKAPSSHVLKPNICPKILQLEMLVYHDFIPTVLSQY